MTCIVGMIDKKSKTMYMGGDSAGVSGLNVSIRKDAKVFINGPMLIEYTSSFRMGQLLRYKLKVPEQHLRTSDYEYMCTVFVDEVRKVLKDSGYTTVNNNEETGGTFLVGYKGTIYQIGSDFQVGIDNEDYDTYGCGTYYASGALDILKDLDAFSIKDKIIKALSVAEKRSGGVSGPFNVISMEY